MSLPSIILKFKWLSGKWAYFSKKPMHTVCVSIEALINFSDSKIDYLLVHELCHAVHYNHSKSFWNLVEKYIPNYKQIKQEISF
jgi:predicted metal-dependent hydrolase